MPSFPSNPFYLKINNFYLDIEKSKNPLNQYRIISSEKQSDSQLWYVKENIIYHSLTNGYLSKKYHGWEAKRSNLLLQTEIDYDILFEPFTWKYDSNYLIANDRYILCKDSNHNLFIQKKDEMISPLINYEWNIILKHSI